MQGHHVQVQASGAPSNAKLTSKGTPTPAPKVEDTSTRASHVITHRSTNRACWCLTSQVGRDGVHSPEYGRIQKYCHKILEFPGTVYTL